MVIEVDLPIEVSGMARGRVSGSTYIKVRINISMDLLR
jgi:hypothetical protein